jgi:hypothetical protein
MEIKPQDGYLKDIKGVNGAKITLDVYRSIK